MVTDRLTDTVYFSEWALKDFPVPINSRPLKYLSPTNSQHINTLFALKYLQVFVSLRLKTCRLYDKKDLSPALIIQFIGRPTDPPCICWPTRLTGSVLKRLSPRYTVRTTDVRQSPSV